MLVPALRSKIFNFIYFDELNSFYKISPIFTMMTISPSSESTTHLSHYGLIAGAFDELDISDLIDDLPPMNSGHNISHSTLIKLTFRRCLLI